ncbi:MAG: hypothetical protein GY884_26460, partial [Proteobacteria bacterium]|nr:hypothetical protein [Pseudomonadota bacterium]
ISCFFPIGVATEDLVEGVDVKRSIRIDRHSGEVIVIHDEWLPGPGWQQLAWQPLWGASMPVCMSSRSIDELFVLVDPDRKDDALSIGPAGGLLQLERWTLIGGPGWPAMVEDASVVAPLGARSGRARWSTTYEGGVRLGRAKRDLFTLVREPLAELDVDPRALEVDPDGRFVLIASHDQGILQVDLTTPGAPAVVAVRPPSPSFSYTLPSGDGYGGGAMDPVLGDSVHGERVLILDDGRGGYWILLDRDNDGAFD